MKNLLALLLLIPSLSWGEVIPLYCEIKKFDYLERDETEWTVKECPCGTHFFYFDTSSKSMIWDIIALEKKFYLKEEYDDSYFLISNPEHTNNYFETISINKKSYRMSINGYANDRHESSRMSECVIKDRIL